MSELLIPADRIRSLLDIGVFRVERRGERRSVRDLAVDVHCHCAAGAGAGMEPIVRTAVGALAAQHATAEPEHFALAIARHCAQRLDDVAGIDVDVRERAWNRLDIGGRPRDRDLILSGDVIRLARSSIHAGVERLAAGFRDLHLLTPGAADAVTVDSLRFHATWWYGWLEVSYDTQWRQVQRVLTEAYTEHDRSQGDLLTTLTHAVLEESPVVSEIELRLERRSRDIVDMTAFGLENTGEVYSSVTAVRLVDELRMRREEVPA